MKKLILLVICLFQIIGVYASQAIALWAFPDKASVTGTTYIGVVAYHASGIESISFTIDGLNTYPIYEETINPLTQEYEFVLELNTTVLSNANHTIVAVAYPNQGEARTLPNLEIIVENGIMHNTWFVDAINGNDENSGTAELPFATILKALNSATGGDMVKLKTGEYNFPGNWNTAFDKFVTIEPADNASPVITSTSQLFKGYIKIKDITFDFSNAAQIINIAYSYSAPHLWYDNCTFIGRGQEDFNNNQVAFRIYGNSGHLTVENCTISGTYRAFVAGGIGRNILRNNQIQYLASDIFNPGSETLITGNKVTDTKAPELFIESTINEPYNVSSNSDFSVHLCATTNTCLPEDYAVYTFANLGSHAANPNSASAQEIVNALNSDAAFYVYCRAEERNGKIRIYSRITNYVQQMWVSGSANNVLGYLENSYENQAEGAGAHSDVFQYWGTAGVLDTLKNLIFRNNKCFNNSSQGIFPGEDIHSENLAFINNLVDVSGKDGWNVNFEGSADVGEGFNNVLFEYNTIWDRGTALLIDNNNLTSTNMTFRNNLFGRRYMGSGDCINNSTSEMDYNCYYWYHWQAPPANSNSLVIQVSINDSIDIFLNVVYDAETQDDHGDFHLSETSPCRDAGTNSSGIGYDIDWNPRDENPDIGAYEYSPSAAIEKIVKNKNNFLVYPNSFDEILNLSIEIDEKENCEIKIIDLNGQVYYNEQITLFQGKNNFKIHTNKIPSGTYIVIVQNKTKILKSPKILKIK